jgi:hypothetical protein
MKNVIHRFFFHAVPIETLGLFRIAAAGFALVQFFVLLPDWMILYGPDGILPWEISEAIASDHLPKLSILANMLTTLHLSGIQTIYLVTGVYLLSLVGLLMGYNTRLMAIVAWLIHLLLNTTGHMTAYGVETFTHISLFYCVVLPVNLALSLDTLKGKKAVPDYLVNLSVRMIQLHLCIMYFASGLEKAMGEQWWNGEAVWIALHQDQFSQLNVDWMASVPWVPKLMCWGTLVIETLFPVGMLWSKTKKLWLPGILSMHLFIAIFLGLHLFGGLMMLLNIAAFGLHSFPGQAERLRATLHRFRRQPGRRVAF